MATGNRFLSRLKRRYEKHYSLLCNKAGPAMSQAEGSQEKLHGEGSRHLPQESGLYLDNAVGNALLLTESWQPDDQLDGVNIVCNDHQLCLARLDQLSDVVEAILDNNGLLLVGLLHHDAAEITRPLKVP